MPRACRVLKLKSGCLLNLQVVGRLDLQALSLKEQFSSLKILVLVPTSYKSLTGEASRNRNDYRTSQEENIVNSCSQLHKLTRSIWSTGDIALRCQCIFNLLRKRKYAE